MNMMLMYALFLLIISSIYHLNITFADDSIAETQVYVIPKAQNRMNTIELSYITRNPLYSSEISSIFTKSSPLINSDCFCSYDYLINLLLCSPLLQNSPSYPLNSTNISILNVTLNDCTFSTNHLTLPILKNQMIDHLRLYDINHQDYLVFDSTSFSFYSINHLSILYSFIQPITMLLISNETFPSSLHTLYFDSCYLITLNKPFNYLISLESIRLINIQQFSWYDFQQQIISLPNLRSIYIGEEILSITNDIFNVISCEDLSSQWILTYRLIQTCSCQLIQLLKTIVHFGDYSRCPNSNHSIDFINDICQFHGKEYKIQNETNCFCNQCLAIQCPNGTLCGETYDSKSNCILLSRYDYQMIRSRIPLTIYTKEFLFQESEEYLRRNSNKTLEPSGFNSIATILIDSNRNHTENTPSDAQMFHQTFSEMLNRPWSPEIYTISSEKPSVWQDLFMSLDESIKNINDNQSIFEFQSKPISTVSLRFPIDQQPKDIFGWKITNDNIITSNITTTESINQNVTTRVFLKFDKNQSLIANCVPSNTKPSCTNRFSITSLKSPKLFYNTDRIPKYDVISIIAPTTNQHVAFYFDQKLSSIDQIEYLINQTNSSSDPFYDQLDRMIPEGICMYLNTTTMIWQTDGCLTDHQLSNNISVICTCEHLTMFTVFFSLTCTTPSKGLEIFSWIGSVLSILGLSITLIMFIVMSQCRQIKYSDNGISLSESSSTQELRRRIMSKPRRLSMVKSMLFILCILLILMNILIFILTFIKSGRNLACTIFSAALYYITLTAFIWKFLFAIQQSLFLTNIFQPYWSDQILFLIYFLIAFSLPICPLIIMFIKYPNSTFISSTCNYCWLTREFLLYGLIIPILVIICLNIILYLYTMIHLCIRNRQQPGLRSTKSDHSRHMQNFKIGLFFAIIMGLSWILGFLVLIPNSYVQFFGNILFCIVNTLQGFAFFMMVFCMLERKSFRKCCCFWRYENRMKKTLNSSNTIPQQLVATSNDENDMKIKTSFNSSIYTTTTSNSGENNNQDINDHYRNKTLPIRKEQDEEEHIYSTLAL